MRSVRFFIALVVCTLIAELAPQAALGQTNAQISGRIKYLF